MLVKEFINFLVPQENIAIININNINNILWIGNARGIGTKNPSLEKTEYGDYEIFSQSIVTRAIKEGVSAVEIYINYIGDEVKEKYLKKLLITKPKCDGCYELFDELYTCTECNFDYCKECGEFKFIIENDEIAGYICKDCLI